MFFFSEKAFLLNQQWEVRGKQNEKDSEERKREKEEENFCSETVPDTPCFPVFQASYNTVGGSTEIPRVAHCNQYPLFWMPYKPDRNFSIWGNVHRIGVQ